MSDLNVCVIAGRLTKDAELTHVGAKALALLKLNLVNKTGVGDRTKTSYFDVQVWGNVAEQWSHLKKDNHIAVSGIMETHVWQDQFGGESKRWVITANQIDLIEEPKTEELPF